MAKVVNITTTRVYNMRLTVEDLGEGAAEIMVDAAVVDDAGNVVNQVTRHSVFDDLPSQVRNNLNNVMKHLSREINNDAAGEDSETWADQ